jgi:integrase
MFNLAIDSKLRACDLIRLRVQDVSVGRQVGMRATVMQQKTHRPVQFEITGPTRECLQAWIHARGLSCGDFLPQSFAFFAPYIDPTICPIGPSVGSLDRPGHLRLWDAFNPANEGLFDLPTDQELKSRPTALGHTKLESTVRYLGIEVDDALEIAEQTEV